MCCLHAILKTIQETAGQGRLGEADKSKPGNRMRLYEDNVGLFVVQIRGALDDGALPGLGINEKNLEVSIIWKELFARFFGEKKMIESVLENSPVGRLVSEYIFSHLGRANAIQDDEIKAPSAPEAHECQAHSQQRAHSSARMNLNAIGYTQHDMDMWQRDRMEVQEEQNRLRRLQNPIQTWRATAGRKIGIPRMSLDRCRLRRNADQEANLDDEGAVNEARICWELESHQAADAARQAEWAKSTGVQRTPTPFIEVSELTDL